MIKNHSNAETGYRISNEDNTWRQRKVDWWLLISKRIRVRRGRWGRGMTGRDIEGIIKRFFDREVEIERREKIRGVKLKKSTTEREG